MDISSPWSKKQERPNNIPSGTTINFSSSNSDDFDFGAAADVYNSSQKKSNNRSALQAQDHVLAERKRRERLTQRFIALSALLPNLKKLDKASVLGDAIKYIKQLEENVKSLQEKTKNGKDAVEVEPVKRPRINLAPTHNNINNNDEYCSSSCDENSSSVSTDNRSSPEIEVRAADGNIMVTICCRRQTGLLQQIFNQVEKFNLKIVSTSVMPFGDTTTNISIIAQSMLVMPNNNNTVASALREAIMKQLVSGIPAPVPAPAPIPAPVPILEEEKKPDVHLIQPRQFLDFFKD